MEFGHDGIGSTTTKNPCQIHAQYLDLRLTRPATDMEALRVIGVRGVDADDADRLARRYRRRHRSRRRGRSGGQPRAARAIRPPP